MHNNGGILELYNITVIRNTIYIGDFDELFEFKYHRIRMKDWTIKNNEYYGFGNTISSGDENFEHGCMLITHCAVSIENIQFETNEGHYIIKTEPTQSMIDGGVTSQSVKLNDILHEGDTSNDSINNSNYTDSRGNNQSVVYIDFVSNAWSNLVLDTFVTGLGPSSLQFLSMTVEHNSNYLGATDLQLIQFQDMIFNQFTNVLTLACTNDSQATSNPLTSSVEFTNVNISNGASNRVHGNNTRVIFVYNMLATANLYLQKCNFHKSYMNMTFGVISNTKADSENSTLAISNDIPNFGIQDCTFSNYSSNSVLYLEDIDFNPFCYAPTTSPTNRSTPFPTGTTQTPTTLPNIDGSEQNIQYNSTVIKQIPMQITYYQQIP